MDRMNEWKESLSEREKALHELAAVMLKKELKPSDIKNDADNGSYFPDKCHGFRSWLKANDTKK